MRGVAGDFVNVDCESIGNGNAKFPFYCLLRISEQASAKPGVLHGFRDEAFGAAEGLVHCNRAESGSRRKIRQAASLTAGRAAESGGAESRS